MRLNTTVTIGLAVAGLLAGSLTFPAIAEDTASSSGPTADPSTVVTFLAELPHRKRALERAANDVSDPSSASFRDYLTVREAAREFGATKAQVDQVIDASLALGLAAEIDPTRLIARISGPVSAWEQAMGTPITYQPSEPGSPYNVYGFPAPTVAPPAASDPDFWVKQYLATGSASLGAPAPLDAAVTAFVASYAQYEPADDVPAQSTTSAGSRDTRSERALYFPGSTKQTPPTNPAYALMDSCINEPGAPLGTSERTGRPFTPEMFVGHDQVFGAYGLTGLQEEVGEAASNRVTIISLGGGFSDTDLADAAECFGYTKPDVRITVGTGVFAPFVNIDGETTLDVQSVASTLKNATSIQMIQGSGQMSFDAALADTYTRALSTTPRPHAVTLSYGGCEPALAPVGMYPTVESIFQFSAVVGTTIAIASGDGGASLCQESAGEGLLPALANLQQAEQALAQANAAGDSSEAASIEQTIAQLQQSIALNLPVAAYPRATVAYPGSSPWAVSVGGTQIVMNPDGTRAGEVPWNDTPYFDGVIGNLLGTGGPSAVFNAPAYQQPLTYSNTRSVPDIAAMGGPFPSLPVVQNGLIQPVGGTSQSSPIMAAAFALLSQAEVAADRPKLGFINPWIYDVVKRQSQTVYDVTIGENQFAIQVDLEGNSFNIPACCQSELGYDQTTGLGVPNFAELRKHTRIRP
ncbi:MAG TPA: S53 family peptidase [Acidimicrobiia bacterium]